MSRAACPPFLMQRLRWAMLRNALRTLFSRSLVRPLTVVLITLLIATLVFLGSAEGFRFLDQDAHVPLDGQIIGVLLDLLFRALGVLLLFSGGLILYGSLFTAPETTFLLATPLHDGRIFACKFQGATAVSAWAFALLGGPILVAYGVARAAPWTYYALLPPFFLSFVLLPASLAAVIVVLTVNVWPRRRITVLTLGVAVVGALGGYWVYQILHEARGGGDGQEAVNRILGHFTFSGAELAPDHWAARGLMDAAAGDVLGSLEKLGLIAITSLFGYLIAEFTARLLYRRGCDRLATGGPARRRPGGAWMDAALTAGLPFVSGRTRLLIVKDFRTFRRDPRQWAQVLIFTVLVTFSIMAGRRVFAVDIGPTYQSLVSWLHLGVVGLLICIYTGRFVFPLLSLEGRKFWILGLLPVDRGQLLWGKFAFASAGALLIGEFLVLLSDMTLEMPWPAVLLHVLTVIVLALGLSGLSVGMGACLPSFRETDPSRIVSGFGGTMNLLAGLLFLLAVLTLTAGPWHLLAASRLEDDGTAAWAVLIGAAMGVALGAAAVVVPLRMGIRALRRMEF
ncbi:MAG TPA: hypothetical protein VMS17_28585 [Gemmataceae bacterium]|nr:hypothetical protein [Gemmataceae bacterium]